MPYFTIYFAKYNDKSDLDNIMKLKVKVKINKE